MKKTSLFVKKLNIDNYNILNNTFSLEANSINQILNENEKGAILFKAILDLIDSKKKCFLYEVDLNKSFSFIGYYSKDFEIDTTLRVHDFYSYSSSFYKNDYTDNLKRLLSKFHINPMSKLKDLDKETIELIKLIEAIYHKPDLLMLNDPYSHINTSNITDINEEIINLKNNNSTIFINSNKVLLNKIDIDSFFLYIDPRFVRVDSLKDKKYTLKIKTEFPLKIKKLTYISNETYIYDGKISDLLNQLDLKVSMITFIKEGEL